MSIIYNLAQVIYNEGSHTILTIPGPIIYNQDLIIYNQTLIIYNQTKLNDLIINNQDSIIYNQ